MHTIFFDLETTGVSTTHDRIIQIALKKVSIKADENGSPKISFVSDMQSLVNPFTPDFINADKKPITSLNPIVSELTGISDNDLKSAPFFHQISKRVLDFIGDCPLAGYNIDNFDFPILVREMERTGIQKKWKNPTIDVFVLYRRLYPSNLSAVYKRLFGHEFENAHSAMADVDATCKIFEKIIPATLPFDDATLLMEAISGKRSDVDRKFKYDEKAQDWVFQFGKHRGDSLGKNIEYLTWMAREETDFHSSTKAFVRVYLDLFRNKNSQGSNGFVDDKSGYQSRMNF
jgi:DNA polymerase-3 subunit epsilon